MSFSSDLFAGLATLLADANIGTYSTSGPVPATDVAIVDKMPPASPDNAIALAQYPVSDDPSLSDSVVGIQVRTRIADPDSRAVDDTADAIFDLLHGMADRQLSTGVHLVLCERRSGLPATQDELRRWERFDNYYVTVWRPSAHRI